MIKPTEKQRKIFDEVMKAYELDTQETGWLVLMAYMIQASRIPCNKKSSKVFSAIAMYADLMDDK